MTQKIQLIVGLGNPGGQYENTRHNAGFWFVDQLAKVNSSSFKADKKYHGDICELNLGGEKVRLLKPMTFMNRSGQAVAGLANFFKIPPESILVAHDELDFPVGKTRLKLGGGHGGHNGLRDIIAKLGNKQFMRLRIGIDHPGSSDQVTGYVLGKPPQKEAEIIHQSLDNAVSICKLLAAGDIQNATQTLHRD